MIEQEYIDIDRVSYAVKPFKDCDEFLHGFAYTKGKYIYPYMGTILNKKVIGIYKTYKGIKIIKPFTKKDKNKYSISNTYILDMEMINNTILTKGLKKEKIDLILGETDEVFSPIITDEDNRLQILIKMALQEKQLDLKNYLPRFKDQTDMNNLKRSLLKHGKMSYEKFLRWCEILDLEFEINLEDSTNSIQPMNTNIYYNSRN